MPKIRRLDNLPKRKVTVDDILDRNELVDALEELISERDNMEEFVGLWVADGHINWITSGLSISRLNYLLDKCKMSLMEE